MEEKTDRNVNHIETLEKSVVFIKPGHFMKAESIISCLELGLREFYGIGFFKIDPIFIIPKRKDIEEHYSAISNKNYFEPTIQEYLQKGMILSPYFSEQEITTPLREIIGNTNPKKANKRSIRSIFSTDSLEEAEKENRFLRNVLHSSANKKEAEREFNIWKKYLF